MKEYARRGIHNAIAHRPEKKTMPSLLSSSNCKQWSHTADPGTAETPDHSLCSNSIVPNVPRPKQQTVVTPQAVNPSPGQLPQFYTEHDAIWYQTPLCPVWASCPGCIPSQVPAKINAIPAKPRIFSAFCENLLYPSWTSTLRQTRSSVGQFIYTPNTCKASWHAAPSPPDSIAPPAQRPLILLLLSPWFLQKAKLHTQVTKQPRHPPAGPQARVASPSPNLT